MICPDTDGNRTAAYRYRLELTDDAGRHVRDQPLRQRDFRPAILATCFSRLLAGLDTEYRPEVEAVRVEPRFASNGDAPHAVGFRIASPLEHGGEHSIEFGIRYFGSRADRIRAELVRTEQIAADTGLQYRLAAYLDDQQPAAAGRPAVSLGRSTYHVPVVARSRAGLGNTVAWDEPEATDPPVLIDRSVVEETVDESRRAPDREIGGVLLGNLCRDEDTACIFVHVTGLVSGEKTVESAEATVTFTPATWRAAHDMIALRAAGESMIGWYHSHPFRLCEGCPLPAPAECVNKILFYSLDDVQLMETWFDQPFMVGLLAAAESRLERSLGHLPVRLFGWRGGQICARGFEVSG